MTPEELVEASAAVRARPKAGLTGWIDCFEKASLKGTVFAGGVTDQGTMTNFWAVVPSR